MSFIKRNKELIIIILFLASVTQVLFDPFTSIQHFTESLQARIGLPLAQRKWDTQGITHYKFDIGGGAGTACIFYGSIEVVDEAVISTGPRSDDNTNRSLLFDLGTSYPESTPAICNYNNYPVTLLFGEVERWLRESPFQISEISFDSKYGFVSEFHFGNCGGHGLLNPKITHCSGGFSIENFQVLDK